MVGVLAGFLNTVASSGSALTLPTMIALGLHPVMANATNRVPIVVGCARHSVTLLIVVTSEL